VTITAIRDTTAHTVLFRAIDAKSYKRVDRIFDYKELQLVVKLQGNETEEEGKEDAPVPNIYDRAILTLLNDATLVRVCRGLQITFPTITTLTPPPPTLFQTTRSFGATMFIVDVLSEPPLSTAPCVFAESTAEYLLLRVRLYDPEVSRYYEATCHEIIPFDVKEKRGVIEKVVKSVEVVEWDEVGKKPTR